ncbi:MAG: response regulator [Methylococcaceae bacterium]
MPIKQHDVVCDSMSATILIVDDKETNVLLLEMLLRRVGYSAISSTTNPRTVCDLHRTNRYDLILLDLEMPGMDGFEVMALLKEIEPDDLPVIVITALPSHKIKALELGAKDFISKPFYQAEVLLRVRAAIEARLLYTASQGVV